MIYKETGQYKSSYKSDHAIFPLIQDKIAFSTLMLVAFLIIPFVIDSYWEKAILVPFISALPPSRVSVAFLLMITEVPELT